MDKIKKYFQGDLFAKYNHIELLEVKQGYAKASMVICENHYNGARIVHGGAIFTLADFAFAVACNTYEYLALSIHSEITIHQSISEGTLIAEANEISLHPKLGTYDVTITNEKHELIASFRGLAYRKSQTNTT